MDYLETKCPMACNMRGVWEHQVCSARNILKSLLRTHGESLNDEFFRTLLVEVEGISNSRPKACESTGDVIGYFKLSLI